MDIGNRHLREVRVVQQRQDRMVKGRGRQLDPALSASRRYSGMMSAITSRCFWMSSTFSFSVNPDPFSDQPFEKRIVLLEERIEPGQIEPDLQVEIVLRR